MRPDPLSSRTVFAYADVENRPSPEFGVGMYWSSFCAGDTGEIAGPFWGSWNRQESRINTFGCASTLIVPEKENLALFDRAVHDAAKLVLFEVAAFRCKKVARVQSCIPEKVKNVAMKSVAAGLCDDVDHSAVVVPILGIEIVR